jgi:hypothetical protein
MTLAGRGLLVEPVPAAATYAAHIFLLVFYTEIIWQVAQRYGIASSEAALSKRTLKLARLEAAVQINIAG